MIKMLISARSEIYLANQLRDYLWLKFSFIANKVTYNFIMPVEIVA